MFRQLDSNQLNGTIPSSIGNLAQLQNLYVHSCFRFRLQSHIKTNTFNPNFSILCVIMFRVLSDNQLTGTIPSSIGNLTQLQYLYVHSCFQFRQPTSTLSSILTSLFLCVIMFRDLDSNQLSGTIPSSIGNLFYLHVLYVHSCFQFHQQIHIITHSFNPNFSIFCVS